MTERQFILSELEREQASLAFLLAKYGEKPEHGNPRVWIKDARSQIAYLRAQLNRVQ